MMDIMVGVMDSDRDRSDEEDAEVTRVRATLCSFFLSPSQRLALECF